VGNNPLSVASLTDPIDTRAKRFSLQDWTFGTPELQAIAQAAYADGAIKLTQWV
jgi:hypothetical protein